MQKSFFPLPPLPYPLPPFSPSLISLMVSVDVKQHVYLQPLHRLLDKRPMHKARIIRQLCSGGLSTARPQLPWERSPRNESTNWKAGHNGTLGRTWGGEWGKKDSNFSQRGRKLKRSFRRGSWIGPWRGCRRLVQMTSWWRGGHTP